MIELEVQLAQDSGTVGDELRGEVVVVASGSARSVTVALRYVERTEDVEVVARTVEAGEVAAGDLAAGQRFPFAVRLPTDALPCVRTRWAVLIWEATARADVFGPDAHAAAPLDVRLDDGRRP